MTDARDIDPARCDICGDQHRHVARLEAGESALALGLALVAVDRAGSDASGVELLHDLVRAMLGATEHEGPFNRLRLQDHRQQGGLFGLVDHRHALVDPVDRRCRRRDRDFGGVGEIAVSKFLDCPGHGCREEQGLALGRDQRDDPLKRMDEAKIEHLVGLIED